MNNFTEKRFAKEKELSSERLYNSCVKRINTTMIGAIATIEKYILDKEEFNTIRSEILDKGNNQIRSLSKDFESYSVSFKNSGTLPIERK